MLADDSVAHTGVGLSHSIYAARRRRMLDVVNALHLTGYRVHPSPSGVANTRATIQGAGGH